jgi:hypothetical protein
MTVKGFKSEVYKHMLATRGEKYKWFLRALRLFKYVSLNPTRGELLESYYVLMRYIDDVVDGDAALPKEYASTTAFVEEKIAFSQGKCIARDSIDYLIAHCLVLGRSLGCDLAEETQDILNSMCFDTLRVGTGNISTREELRHHFDLLDIRGTIKGALKVVGDNPQKYALIQPLGLASRIYYNLRDYRDDIYKGIVNIPKEDIVAYHIKDITNLSERGIQTWFFDQARQGQDHIRTFREISHNEFKPLTDITLHLVYELPAQRYFRRALASERL